MERDRRHHPQLPAIRIVLPQLVPPPLIEREGRHRGSSTRTRQPQPQLVGEEEEEDEAEEDEDEEREQAAARGEDDDEEEEEDDEDKEVFRQGDYLALICEGMEVRPLVPPL
jgi:hypothetical protein